MKPFKIYLTEIFDSPVPVKWNSLKTNRIDWKAKTELPDKSKLVIEIDARQEFNGTYEDGTTNSHYVGFYRTVKGKQLGGLSRFDKTNMGNASQVFATVIAAIEDHIKRQAPDRIVFSANKEDGDTGHISSRERLYDRMTKKFAANIGWKVNKVRKSGGTHYHVYNPKKDHGKIKKSLFD